MNPLQHDSSENEFDPTRSAGEDRHVFNEDFPWDSFDSEWYHGLNYASLRSDDREILCIVRDFFAEAYARDKPPTAWGGIDVGAGANLYPSLCMLPFCERIRLHEFSVTNVAWLKQEIGGGYRASWDPFWRALTEREAYARVADPRERLQRVADVRQDSVFRLPDRDEGGSRDVFNGLASRAWDVGTMFFGAESMTTDLEEFKKAMWRFMHALRPGAPFAAAFMMDSKGYTVGEVEFPAVAIKEHDVTECLDGLAYGVEVKVTGLEATLRKGYGGMIVATGRVSDDGGKA
ncbi:SCO2525 family SAM-dependent methyltransferase [Phytomonospora sp. NPDC050363]|uniref:SCO2525 family SAM-dependent methyltransferase n=1 Tax=Phytomonospora sp. NPDC050363 TaxID=3155642 RepID=UPI0033D9EB59